MGERDIFHAARDLTDPLARSAYLDRACGGDAGLRSRVEALLRAHDNPDTLLDRPAAAPHAPGSETTVADDGHDGDAEADDEVPLGFLAPATRPDSLGRIGHYEVLQVLGHGGFGIVFRAFDEVLHRVVAVKVLAPQLAATSPARKRFLREARSSAQVRHENVVQVYEVGEQPLPYIAMEFIPGETLKQRLDRTGPVDVAELVRIGRQIAEGLAAAHATDLIHRDIKPGNILIEGGQLRVKITDFGLARAADDASLSQSGIIAGTPMYMAPEQARGETLDQRADLFSLGSVLYVMAAGRPPFRANSTVAVLRRVAEDDPRPIREVIPETPQWLCDIIAKLHAKKAADRYQSAREVADVLADCEAQLKASARLKDFSRIPRSKPSTTGKSVLWKRVAAAAVLLPVLSLAATEFSGATNLLRAPQVTQGPIKPAGNSQAQRPAGWHGWPAEAPKPAIAPFDAAQARAHQEAWAEYLKVPVEYNNSIGMKFRLIPPGEFAMGSPEGEIPEAVVAIGIDFPDWRHLIESEAPKHKVILSKPFYMSIYEVTQGQYASVMGTHPSYFSAQGGGNEIIAGADTTRYPVESVDWDDAVRFCAKLSVKEGLRSFPFEEHAGQSEVPQAEGYRLPTEAEWEFACRAGTATRYWSGDPPAALPAIDWIGPNAGGMTHEVGTLDGNPFGIFDMHGNVYEWVQDSWMPTYYSQFRGEPALDPVGPTAGDQRRMIRGGHWGNQAVHSRASSRAALGLATRMPILGFRATLPVDAARATK